MKDCAACGLSMPDGATFCPTCLTPVHTAPVAGDADAPAESASAGAPSASPAGYETPYDDGYASSFGDGSEPEFRPGVVAEPSRLFKFLSNNTLIVVAVAFIVLGFVGGLVSGAVLGRTATMFNGSFHITRGDYDRIEIGMSRDELEMHTATPTLEKPDVTNRQVTLEWVNDDGSRAQVVLVDGVVKEKSQTGLEGASKVGSGLAVFLLFVGGLVASLAGALLRSGILCAAVLRRGYNISLPQWLILAAVLLAGSFVPFGGTLAWLVVWGLIYWWTSADILELIIIWIVSIVISIILMFVLTIPFVLGLFMGARL